MQNLFDKKMSDKNLSNNSKQKSKRLIELDSLRGLACLSIMLFHYSYYYEDTWGHLQQPLILFEFGRYGVELFLLLSGFFVFMSLKNKNIKNFLFLRFWRLFPTYWVAIIFIFLIGNLVPLVPLVTIHGRLSIPEFLGNFTMIPTVFSFRYIDRSHWTLGFELLFYIHLALIFALCKTRENIIMYVLLFWTTIAIFWHKFIGLSGIKVWDTIWWREDMAHWQYPVAKLFLLPYIHLFLIGISFYFIYKQQKYKTAIAVICFCIIADYLIWGYYHTIPVIVDIAILAIALFIQPAFLRNKFLVYIGTISYSLYLVHQNIGFRVIQIAENSGVNSNIAIFIAILVAFLIAHPLYYYVEQPSYQWIRQKLTEQKLAFDRAN